VVEVLHAPHPELGGLLLVGREHLQEIEKGERREGKGKRGNHKGMVCRNRQERSRRRRAHTSTKRESESTGERGRAGERAKEREREREREGEIHGSQSQHTDNISVSIVFTPLSLASSPLSRPQQTTSHSQENHRSSHKQNANNLHHLCRQHYKTREPTARAPHSSSTHYKLRGILFKP